MKDSTGRSDVTIGLDLGDKRSYAIVLDAAGEGIEDRSVATSQDAFQRVFNEYTGALLVMEVGSTRPGPAVSSRPAAWA